MQKWIGRILFGLIVLFFTVDAVTHMMKIQPVVEAFQKLHIPLEAAVPLGTLQILCALLALVPRTRILGAILIVGYLGGAVATHVNAGSTLFEMVFPILLGVVLGAGLWLLDPRARQIVSAP